MELTKEDKLKEVQVLIKLRGLTLRISEIFLGCKWPRKKCRKNGTSSGVYVFREGLNGTAVRIPCKNHLGDYLREGGWAEL